ncbi:hypothetical protein ACWD6L_10575 [Micromonospora profundi]|uniref:Uncharacterized protein n=1 Tax=Micromonospora profundi TaxID=1420889 RepID=A0AAJ6L5K5_9ACTN|nr:hypothetical protein [Micromonospora profundi]NJC15866.1 hypothetical protein [Micromonospora profundi]WLS47311.1 hypothetical protein Q3V37_08795 [Micromonospora profundi]
MDAGADDRLGSAVLAGVAVAALVVGGWWWRATAPEPTAGPARPTAEPSAEPSVSTVMERVVASGMADGPVRVRIDPETGEVSEAQTRSRVVIDPATGMIVDIDGPPGDSFGTGDLPLFKETVWRERRELTPGEAVIRQSADNGARHLLQVRCTRLGSLAVKVTGARLAGSPRIDCDGTIATAVVLPDGGRIRVSLVSTAGQPVDVQAQLVTVP